MKGNVAESLSDQLQRLGSKEDWYAKGGMVNTKYKRGDQVVATRTIPGKVQRGDLLIVHHPGVTSKGFVVYTAKNLTLGAKVAVNLAEADIEKL